MNDDDSRDDELMLFASIAVILGAQDEDEDRNGRAQRESEEINLAVRQVAPFCFGARLRSGAVTDGEVCVHTRCERKEWLDAISAALGMDAHAERFGHVGRFGQMKLPGAVLVARAMAYLKSPTRMMDLRLAFGVSKGNIVESINHVINVIWQRRFELSVTSLLMRRDVLDMCACAMDAKLLPPNVFAAGHSLNYFASLDGKLFNAVAGWERLWCSRKKSQAMNSQFIVTPIGILLFGGCVPGSSPDVEAANILPQLGAIKAGLDVQHLSYHIVADCAYAPTEDRMGGFVVVRRTPWVGMSPAELDSLERFNAVFSSIRTCVEWCFSFLVSSMSQIDYRKKIRPNTNQRPERKILAATVLSNCLTCLRGRNQISDYFGVRPPTLEEYLATFNDEAVRFAIASYFDRVLNQ